MQGLWVVQVPGGGAVGALGGALGEVGGTVGETVGEVE